MSLRCMPEEEGNEEDWRELHYWSRPVIDGIHEEDGPVFSNESGMEPEPHPEAPEVEWPEEESFSQFVMRQVEDSRSRCGYGCVGVNCKGEEPMSSDQQSDGSGKIEDEHSF